MSEEVKKPRLFHRVRGDLKRGLEPIVIEYESDDEDDATVREDSEQYSEGLEDVQQLEADLVRVARRASNAVSKGIETYDDERSRSAKEKKDGAIEDFPHNSAKALSESLKEASEIPLDVADAITTKNYRKRLRRSLKRVSKTLRTYRI